MWALLVCLVAASAEKVGVELDEAFSLEWEFFEEGIEFYFTVSANSV